MTKMLTILTLSESKRLIAKGIASMERVQRAYKHGIIGFALCTSNAYIIEELTGTGVDKASYCTGLILSEGLCHREPEIPIRQVAVIKGEVRHLDFPGEPFGLLKIISEMDDQDIIFKSGNALDLHGKAGCLCASPDCGEAGIYSAWCMSKGIGMIVPMTLNKTIPVALDSIIPRLGISKIRPEMSGGTPVGMVPLPGEVVTEVTAIRALAGADALPVAMGGIGSGEGAVTLLIEGEDRAVEKTREIVRSIKGEPKLEPRGPFATGASPRGMANY
jgi:hypothetical protein